ncbi:MAG: hypothetical protein AAF211_03685 [Myxococcota bacterium]
MADDRRARPTGTTAGTLMVVSGAANMMWASAVIWIPCIGTLAVLPGVIGLMEVIVGTTILGKQPSERVRMVSALGLLSGLLTMNPVSAGLEVVALITQSNKPKQLEG